MGHGLLQHVLSVRHVGAHVIHLRFEDGVEGDVDLRDVVGEFSGLLAPLANPAFVAKVSVNARGTITWPGELDLDPVVLYCAVKGIPVPSYEGRGAVRRPRGSHSPSPASERRRGTRR